MRLELLSIDPSCYHAHPLHTTERTWSETNCYVDLWVEVLHSLGLDPLAASAFSLATDFEGDQWAFFKFPPEDLRALFGVEVAEMNVWRSVLEHVEEQLRQGCLVTVEVDAWFLPDTASVTYRCAHAKTTVVPQMLDIEGKRLGYFHNAGYFELEGGDFEGIFRLESSSGSPVPADKEWVPPPYMERIRLERIRREHDLLPVVLELTRDYVSRRPETNPVHRFAKRLRRDVDWLSKQDLDTFDSYAFGTCRQCGAAAELAASFLDWLTERAGTDLSEASHHFRTISSFAKTLEFALARTVRGRAVDLSSPLDEMESAWEGAMSVLVPQFGT